MQLLQQLALGLELQNPSALAPHKELTPPPLLLEMLGGGRLGQAAAGWRKPAPAAAAGGAGAPAPSKRPLGQGYTALATHNPLSEEVGSGPQGSAARTCRH